eukprot:TRINITY_DN1554_c0_g1_i1.p1 TRINITY_DN1554_c0_g1~~TRINITY_DN1554_c0_g1_i1.p1  ORF type:complete len:274 (-),score=69.78 TRINITY_DN1554_c0_g1_i1:371-1192(-)
MEDIEKQKVDTLGTQDEVQVLRRASTSSNLGLDFFIKVRDIPGALESLNEGIEELESLRERMEKTTVEDQEDKLIQMTTKKLNGLAKQAQDGREMLSEVTRELIRAKEEGDESEEFWARVATSNELSGRLSNALLGIAKIVGAMQENLKKKVKGLLVGIEGEEPSEVTLSSVLNTAERARMLRGAEGNQEKVERVEERCRDYQLLEGFQTLFQRQAEEVTKELLPQRVMNSMRIKVKEERDEAAVNAAPRSFSRNESEPFKCCSRVPQFSLSI